MAKSNTIGIIIGVAIALLLGVILVQIIAQQTVNKVQNEVVTDTFTLVRDGPGTANVSNDINATASVFTLTKVDDAWRQSISECALATTIDSNRISAYNTSGAALSMNGCSAGGDFYLVDTVNSITFCNQSVSTNGTGSSTVTVTYTTCPTEYVSGWGATVFKLIPGFFVLALLIGAAFVIFYILKNEGIEINI